MGKSIDGFIQFALQEEGYLEKKNGDTRYLYDKTANAGSANYTKYGKEMHDLYPAVMDYPAFWCDAFVDWIFQKYFGVSTAKSLLCGNFDDYTVNSAQMYKNKGQYYKSNPRKGDQIFFKNSQRICHTGLVVKVDSAYVYTIEGNTSGASGVIANGGGVCQKKYKLGASNIDGYGRPNYQAFIGESLITPQPIEVPSGGPNKKEQWVGEVTASSLNIRKGAGTEFGLLSSYPSLKKGYEVSVCDYQKASDGSVWYYIKISGSKGDKYGFAHSSYIKAKGSSKPVNIPSSPMKGTYKVKASGLNLRSQAGVLTKATVVTVLRNGTKVSCDGTYKTVNGVKWLYVTSGKYKGYVSSDYLVKC